MLDVLGYKRFDHNANIIDEKPIANPNQCTWNVRVTDEAGWTVLRCGLSGHAPRKVRTYVSPESEQ